MKKQFTLLFILLVVSASAQTALYNNGNVRIHEGGNLGFHTNLINVSPFDSNLGLVGFYGPQPLTVSGTLTPQFYDVEIALDNDLQLAVGVDNSNNTNFILGSIRTPLTQPEIFYTFLNNSFYTGETDVSKVEGYAAITNQQNFGFPVGDSELMRPLILNSESTNLFAKSAYFFEDANTPASLPGSFNTFAVALDVDVVSAIEFWRLEGNIPSTVTLSWNSRSEMVSLTDDADKIIPVGWSKLSQRWINLSGSIPVGNLTEGFVSTEQFNPDDYEIITLGVSRLPYEPLSREVLSLDNYIVSVNDDGVNDSFFIPELEDLGTNLVQIYDRYGLKVFEMANYIDEFAGFSNLNNVPFSSEKGLPIGVYFYTIYISEGDLNYQGFLYLAR
ncbi:gliding motility-associated C-terminal domain-containing protein [Maribacter sp. ACAM166]|uniref:T9SS type B sorting domain-containing protein n=1 Tax=Maribacter sp. ACAM166 TaxID=2508996 RepID=UPI0010FD2432|nr:gliding motility-associated C-terminal domain-containing protein [Maribacter sp. ACAM166]TLP80975.1 gliding motility-associated C-terminal domain-containing protein [Maribacter sp. ACAM166]